MKRILAILVCLGLSGTVFAQNRLDLKLVSFSDGKHQFYHELITESLKAIGYTVNIQSVADVPQPRIDAMLEQGELSLYWYLPNAERNQKYLPITVGLTNGLIGHRVLFIKKGAQAEYNNVRTLDQFRALNKVGGFGKNWFDVRVWSANNLRYYEQEGDWKVLYRMVEAGNRGVDYFSRGINEIVAEAPQYPNLDVEQNLMLVYDRDFQFFVAPGNRDLVPILTRALNQARQSGLIDRLVRKHYAEVFSRWGFERRIKIQLQTPTN